MPPIKDRLVRNGQMPQGFVPVPLPTPAPVIPVQRPPKTTMRPGPSWTMRCPLPPVYSANPDSLIQYYKGSRIPQQRILSTGIIKP